MIANYYGITLHYGNLMFNVDISNHEPIIYSITRIIDPQNQ